MALAFAACPPSGWHVARVILTKIKHGQTLSCVLPPNLSAHACKQLIIHEWSEAGFSAYAEEGRDSRNLPATLRARTHPGADELLVEDDPGHEVDEADAGGEEGGDLGGAQDLEGEHVEVGGQRPQQREEEAPHEEGPCKTAKRESLFKRRIKY